jgi:hypothetical protein
MLICEIQHIEARVKLNALARYIKSRLDDTESDDFVPRKVFVRVANNIGIPISNDNIEELISQSPFEELVSSVDKKNIYFNGKEEPMDKDDIDFEDDIDSEPDAPPPEEEIPDQADSIEQEPSSAAPPRFEPETPEKRVEKMAKRSLSRRI